MQKWLGSTKLPETYSTSDLSRKSGIISAEAPPRPGTITQRNKPRLILSSIEDLARMRSRAAIANFRRDGAHVERVSCRIRRCGRGLCRGRREASLVSHDAIQTGFVIRHPDLWAHEVYRGETDRRKAGPKRPGAALRGRMAT